MAAVRITGEAYQQAEKLPKVIHARVMKLVKRLEKWPAVSGAKALSGNLAGWYRLRTGDYRVRFRVAGERITVEDRPSERVL
jgi:mRNA-degrading endonuclease RelE of RelBE toxin-antitoxin system